MVILTVLHVPSNLKPIPVPRAHLPKLIELLKEKVSMGILEPSNAPYSNRWFTVPKKNGSFPFIQDLQPVNKVTIRNAGIGPSADEFTEAFAGGPSTPLAISTLDTINSSWRLIVMTSQP